MLRRLPAVLLGGLLLLLGLPALAAAAPVTVDLRIEGAASTLYEGTVTTDTRSIDLHDGTGVHACDGTTNPETPNPGPTRGAAFMTAAEGSPGFTFTGTYTFDMGFTVIAGADVDYDPGTGQFLAEYKNGQFASFGSCGDQIANGDKLLYAYSDGTEPLLELRADVPVAGGTSVRLTVTDAASGTPISGASVGGTTTGADGSAQVTLAAPGPVTFKATKPATIRSNAVTVCSTNGADGACGAGPALPPPGCVTSGRDGLCGSRDLTAPRATITAIKDGQRFSRAGAPRTLHVSVPADPSGLHAVKLRLTRTDGRRCTYFSGGAERFKLGKRGRCGAENGFWFGVGAAEQTDYLLPSKLPRGRYVLDANVIDKAFNRDDARRRGANRVVFRVA
jgi:hypothetical protein